MVRKATFQEALQNLENCSLEMQSKLTILFFSPNMFLDALMNHTEEGLKVDVEMVDFYPY